MRSFGKGSAAPRREPGPAPRRARHGEPRTPVAAVGVPATLFGDAARRPEGAT